MGDRKPQMPHHVAIVEDQAEMAELIQLYLGKEGIRTTVFDTAEAALADLASTAVDLIVLDINLPGMSGFEFLERYRKGKPTPVLIVSARSEDEDIITGLGFGADEFVTKPFSPRVLVARIRALLRKAGGEGPPASSVTFGEFVFFPELCLLQKGGVRVPLSPKEHGILEFLVAQGGRPATPQAIYQAVWKNQYGDLTAVGVYIQRLRKKLGDSPESPQFIETIPGMGYRLVR
jgi:two-component system response regulator RegX3